jgi:hypothetical protein
LEKLFECATTAGKGADTSMSAKFSDLVQDNSPPMSRCKEAPEDKSLEYFQRFLGMIMFVVCTRPDIAYAVNRMAMRTPKATEKDVKALRRIAAYLYQARTLELVYSKGTGSPELYAYSDASFISHSDGKSHMGFCIGYGSNSRFFYARSSKQKMVTLSSTESETYSAVETAKDIIYFRNVLIELGFPIDAPSSIRVDNNSLIELATRFFWQPQACPPLPCAYSFSDGAGKGKDDQHGLCGNSRQHGRPTHQAAHGQFIRSWTSGVDVSSTSGTNVITRVFCEASFIIFNINVSS